MSTIFLSKIIDLLEQNKRLPNYQAERRIDIFINYFLEKILTNYFDEEVVFVCPEFPLKKDKTNRSTKLDYLCKTKDEIIFVELKTDVLSFDEQQAFDYLEWNWKDCIKGLNKITESKSVQQNKVYKEKYIELNKRITDNIVSEKEYKIRVIYISPILEKAFTKIEIVNVKKLIDTAFEMTFDELIIWEFLNKLEFNIFEVKLTN